MNFFDKLKEFISKNKRLILIVVAILLILVIVFLSLPPPKQDTSSEKTIPGSTLIQTTTTPAEASSTDKAKSSITVVAKNFAEVYGSYSNQSNYANLESAMLLASASYKNTLSNLLKQYRASYQPAAEYQGVTTTAINIVIESFDDKSGKAVVSVKTQRKESTGTQANYTIKYQDIRLSIIKENGNWKIDGASWL